ncbi:hypothetical protein AB6A40_008376 [Gnathostoma spinigerum]|uniref:H15 domain-containing protein n=1 Tax=Gnathostoma spinigerum TaxID=75299 RepID=A0ABD6EYI7_9BILA
MSATEVSAPPAVKPKKAKVAKPKTAASHPTYQQMVKSAIAALNDRKGSSRAAILKYIVQHFKVGDNMSLVGSRLRIALKRGVVAGALKQVKGTGATGSFRLGQKVAVKKPKASKTAKPKKAAAAKKPKAKSPKKAKKVVKKAKKPKSPKKAAVKPKVAKPKVSKPKVKKAAA